jgi:hypothetical protein
VVFWNILCEALGSNQFMTDGGDDINTTWDSRKEKICNKIADQIINGSIVTCVEVDNYPWMMNYFKTNFPYLNIEGVYMPKVDINKKLSNNNLSIYITTLLNKYDSNTEIVPNLTGEKRTNAYKQLVDFVNNDPNSNISTFESNYTSENYMKYIKHVINFPITKDMPYVSFDCSIILWSKNDYDIYNTILPENNYSPYTNGIVSSDSSDSLNKFNINHFESNGFMGARFNKTNVNNKFIGMFDVFVAHIKSGENETAEFERVKSFNRINHILKGIALHNHVLCMDSNSSNQYENKFNKNAIIKDKKGLILGSLDMFLSDKYEETNYNNNISKTKDTICWKMRAGSEQIDKNGELMADNIDVILTPKYLYSCMFIPYVSTLTYNDYYSIMKWRNNPLYRAAIKISCNNNNDLWGLDINKNTISFNLAKYLLDTDTYPSDKNNCDNENTELVRNIFKKMYPNNINPSDHPMVGTTIYFDK